MHYEQKTSVSNMIQYEWDSNSDFCFFNEFNLYFWVFYTGSFADSNFADDISTLTFLILQTWQKILNSSV